MTIERSGSSDVGALSWLVQMTSIALCAALNSASVAISRAEQRRVAQHRHDRVREHAERDADGQPRRERQRRWPPMVVTKSVADERPDRTECSGGEVEDARHPVHDDDRQCDERGECTGCHPEEDEPQRGLAEELGRKEHVQLFSSLNGFVASLKSDTRTYFPSSTRVTIASRV